MGASKKVKLTPYSKPALKFGDYEVRLSQKVFINQFSIEFNFPRIDVNFEQQTHAFYAKKSFRVAGEQYQVQNREVHACFPPAHSQGDYHDVLPHLVLKNPQLAWEWPNGLGTSPATPWFFLLLLTEDEIDLGTESGDYTCQEAVHAFEDLFDLNRWSEEDQVHKKKQLVNTLDVADQLVDDLFPSPVELPYLCHLRSELDGDEPPQCFVVGNRVAPANKKVVIHLVSLVNRYANGKLTRNIEDCKHSPAEGYHRFVSLYQWRFENKSPKFRFETLARDLDQGLLRSTASFKHDQLNRLIGQGHQTMRHHFRHGQKTVSLFGGPLRPIAETAAFSTEDPIDADGLYRFHQDLQMFDVSYAAAFELGRFRGMEDRTFTEALVYFKHRLKQQIKEEEILKKAFELESRTGQVALDDDVRIPALLKRDLKVEDQRNYAELITNWLKASYDLKRIPFNYLVPSEDHLPVESIRFFRMDYKWIESFCKGAFSLGRVTSLDKSYETQHYEELITAARKGLPKKITGFLMRSFLVQGWPDILIDAYDQVLDARASASDNPLKLFSKHHFSEDVVLYLFEGQVRTVDLYLKPSAFHFNLTFTSQSFEQKDLQIDDMGLVQLDAFARNHSPRLAVTQLQEGLIDRSPKIRFTITGV